MENNKKHHYKSFWPLVIICVVAALVAGVILGKAYGNELEENLNSIGAYGHKKVLKREVAPAPVPVPGTNTATSAQ